MTSIYSTDYEQMIQNNNAVFEIVIDGLVSEGFLVEEMKDRLLKEYGVITYKPNMFSSIYRKFFDKENLDKFYLRFVRLI